MINILVIPSDRTGVSKYRSLDPHLCLQKLFPDDFKVDIDYQPDLDNDEFLKRYDIVHYHRSIGPDWDRSVRTQKKLKQLGIKGIMDLDDYWLPTYDHPAYTMVKKHKMDVHIKNSLREAEYVTTTTTIFADEIRGYCKNVEVFPNAVDPSQKQFTPNVEESDRIRVGWLGGSSHMADLDILRGITQKLSNHNDKLQFVLCGFDVRGSLTTINPQTGEETTRPIKPEESIWHQYEKIFTNNYESLDEKYKKHLFLFKQDLSYGGEKDSPYRRVWTRPITTYANNYNLFDISLAPLKEHIFNKVKSQLKVIEAGFHKKALIAQDFGPYQIDCVHEKNSLLVEKRKNHKGWDKSIKRLMMNPNMITDLGEQLYEDVQKYHINKVTTDRAEWYKSLIK
tara:strand:- start:747 stop:1931 length:1185 start_codon:yes stop_codon:yes gene_type:complete